jgi:hypothetical protein
VAALGQVEREPALAQVAQPPVVSARERVEPARARADQLDSRAVPPQPATNRNLISLKIETPRINRKLALHKARFSLVKLAAQSIQM